MREADVSSVLLVKGWAMQRADGLVNVKASFVPLSCIVQN
jgi:hypothetical protein